MPIFSMARTISRRGTADPMLNIGVSVWSEMVSSNPPSAGVTTRPSESLPVMPDICFSISSRSVSAFSQSASLAFCCASLAWRGSSGFGCASAACSAASGRCCGTTAATSIGLPSSALSAGVSDDLSATA
ncbi:hypothetical protein L904_02510 [Agrobacterium sp. LY4]|nr:hypothetical protein L904_02510 [Agrobacterium sp. LY4]